MRVKVIVQLDTGLSHAPAAWTELDVPDGASAEDQAHVLGQALVSAWQEFRAAIHDDHPPLIIN